MLPALHNPERHYSHYFRLTTPERWSQARARDDRFERGYHLSRVALTAAGEAVAIVPKVFCGTATNRLLDLSDRCEPREQASLQSLGLLGVANLAGSVAIGLTLGLACGLVVGAAHAAIQARRGHAQAGELALASVQAGVRVAMVITIAFHHLGEYLRTIVFNLVLGLEMVGIDLGLSILRRARAMVVVTDQLNIELRNFGSQLYPMAMDELSIAEGAALLYS